MDERDLRLKAFVKEKVRAGLMETGRRLVVEKGVDFLTARKLSEASGVSVGTIYNLFATMEQFIEAQNMQTLDEVFELMSMVIEDANPYINISRYVDAFSGFVLNNGNLWQLLFRDHLFRTQAGRSFAYSRKIKRIEKLIDRQLEKMFDRLSYKERRLSAKVLEMSLFALSGFLAGNVWDDLRDVNKRNISGLLLNTYLAGLATLKKG